jgi:GNAT superfamily N-acetyltransferase
VTISIRPIAETDVDGLQALLEACTEYAEQVTGYPTGPSDALSTLLQVPEGLPEDRKTVLGAWEGGRLVGVADVLLGFPDGRTTTLGLLLVAPDRRRRGIGRALHDAVVERARTATDVVRIGIVDTNAPVSSPVFARLGSAPVGDAEPFRYDELKSVVRHWRLPL